MTIHQSKNHKTINRTSIAYILALAQGSTVAPSTRSRSPYPLLQPCPKNRRLKATPAKR